VHRPPWGHDGADGETQGTVSASDVDHPLTWNSIEGLDDPQPELDVDAVVAILFSGPMLTGDPVPVLDLGCVHHRRRR
jgi:hypothetical protein